MNILLLLDIIYEIFKVYGVYFQDLGYSFR